MASFSQMSMAALFVGLCVLTWNDMTSSQPEPTIQKDIKSLKLTKFAGPTIKFMFCYSWGYRKVFEQYAQAIQHRFPSLQVEGENFPPTPTRAAIAQFLSIFKLALIGLIISGQDPFPCFNMQAPSIFIWAISNKIYSCMMVFFLSNALEGHLISTGAFEVTFNDVPVWSKLENGRIPSSSEMFQIIDNHMRLHKDTSPA